MPIQNWQTVAIPFAAGIKPTSRGRVLEQSKLLTAQNCFYDTDEGPQKRFGHTTRPIKNSNSPVASALTPPTSAGVRENFSLSDPLLDNNWLHGYGLYEPPGGANIGQYTEAADPRAGYTFGQWTRDDDIVFWDGFRALSYNHNSAGQLGVVSGPAVMPAQRAYPIAKTLEAQTYPDAADNGVVRAVIWLSGSTPKCAIYDSQTGAELASPSLGLTNSASVRCITAGPWIHFLIDDTDEIFLKSCHQDTPGTIVSRTIGATTSDSFDVRKYNEDQWYVAKILTNQITIYRMNQNGTFYTSFAIDQGGRNAEVVAFDVHHSNAFLGVAWQEPGATPQVNFCLYDSNGLVVDSRVTVTSTTTKSRISVADSYLSDVMAVYVEDEVSSRRQVRIYHAQSDTADLVHTRHNVTIASHGFRVGQRPYIWLAPASAFTLQPTWFLCDEKLLPVGKQSFGLAYLPPTSRVTLPGVNWRFLDSTHTAKDVMVFSGAMNYRQRADTSAITGDPNGVWAEPSITFYQLDFLPTLRHAQAGRSTYIAGAQLWEYDGKALNEAGFNMAPEGYTVADGGAGNLDETKTYRWRIDLCAKNAQNEEVRSWSTTVSVAANAFGGATFQATITIPHVPMTRRDNAYFLVYRTEGNGVNYYLVSSRDSTVTGANGFVKNNRTTATYTFTDNLSDTNLIAREYHPANASGWIQPLPAPSCETVAAGRDRLWLAGGELADGEIAPSRYFQPGETPSFSPALNIQIDRNAEPITAIGFVGEQAVFFRQTSTYTLNSDGPDNTAQGVWGSALLALSDVGAVAQETLALAGEGLYFQSQAGIRVITQGGGLRPPGAGLIGGLGTDVDTLASVGTYAAAVVIPKYSQIRWYSKDPNKPTLVVDYTKNIWTTYTGVTCRGASFWQPGDTVILSKEIGEVWIEDSTRYLDGDKTYETIVKTAWLHAAGLGDYERARRWALFGEASNGLNLRYRVFYDERPFHSEEGTLSFIGTNPTTKFNPSVWGNVNWGFGPWGDESAETNVGNGGSLWFRDGVFRFRKRFARQKCSVFSIELSDQGSNAAFVPIVLALELGLKPGLDRIP